MKNTRLIVLITTIAIILLGLFFIATSRKNKVELISFDDIETKVNQNEYVFLYNGEIEKHVETFIKELRQKYRVKIYQVKLSNEDREYLETEDVKIEGTGYIVFVEGEVEGFISSNYKNDLKIEYVKKYLYGYIPEDERNYQVLSKSSEYIKKVNSKDYTIAVFGYSGCTHCTLYLSTINEVAEKYNLNIYYFDKDNYDKNEYQKIMELDFTIPADCTQRGSETSLKRGFDSPLTLITKNGELKGCIKGNVPESELINKLKEFKLVKGVK